MIKLSLLVAFVFSATAMAHSNYPSRSWPELLKDPNLKLGFPLVMIAPGFGLPLNKFCLQSEDILRTINPVQTCVANSSEGEVAYSPLGCTQMGSVYATVSRHVSYPACDTTKLRGGGFGSSTSGCPNTTVTFDYPTSLMVKIYFDMHGYGGGPTYLPYGAKEYDVPNCAN